VLAGPDPSTGIGSVRTSDGGSITDAGIIGNRGDVAAADTSTAAYREMVPVEASRQRRADAIAAQVAEAVSADVFLTDRPYLHSVTWKLARGVTILHPQAALPLISLYLRSQGEFIVFRNTDGKATHRMNRGLFYWVATRELLPSAWRWFAACVQHGRAAHDDAVVSLAQSALMRVTRALQSRDSVHIALNRPQNNDIADDALSALDVVLLLLMGSADATARIAHHALSIPGSPRLAAWHRDGDWLREVFRAAPAFERIVGSETPGRHALTILSVLRNSVHGEAMQPLAVRQSSAPQRTAVSIPTADTSRFIAAITALGGKEAWGVEQLIPGRLHADPGLFLEAIFPRILDVLNALMGATPVECLSGVALTPEEVNPPATSPFDERTRLSLRWQLGF